MQTVPSSNQPSTHSCTHPSIHPLIHFFFQIDQGEAEQEQQRKWQTAQEVKRYNEYIQQVREFEKQREKQIEEFFVQEQNKVVLCPCVCFCHALSFLSAARVCGVCGVCGCV